MDPICAVGFANTVGCVADVPLHQTNLVCLSPDCVGHVSMPCLPDCLSIRMTGVQEPFKEFHNAQGAMHANKVVPSEVEAERGPVVLPLLREGVRQSGK